MTCRTVDLGNGTRAIVCGVRQRRKRCAHCGTPCGLLCDWKLGKGKTCDAPICSTHALEVAPDKHLCPTHQASYRDWLDARRGAAP